MPKIPSPKILLVDDDPQSLESTRKILELEGYEVITARDGQEGLDIIRPGIGFDVVVTDVRMPRLGGLEFLRALSLCARDTPTILMTAFGRVEEAVWAMKLGAVDFLTKPFKRQALVSAVQSALKRSRKLQVDPSQASPGASETSTGLIGRSPAIEALKAQIAQVAPTAATVLLSGESGTGKELVSRCIHESSPRASSRLIALNCAAVPEQLIESELFGFEKGAFTGATVAKEGLFEAAHGGTLLLDEIGDMPFGLQAKLLRALQEGEVRRLGATAPRKVDVRVIAATHRDLREFVRAGKFRQDLLFRLEVISLHVPALRERMSDLPELASHFLAQARRRHGKGASRISAEALAALQTHDWPGNVRELSNVIERAVVFCNSDTIDMAELPPHIVDTAKIQPRALTDATISVRVGMPLKEVEDLMIRKTLEATDGDKNFTAKLLGINSRTIYRKLDKKSERDPEGPAPEPDPEV